jgi:hypothetical protein
MEIDPAKLRTVKEHTWFYELELPDGTRSYLPQAVRPVQECAPTELRCQTQDMNRIFHVIDEAIYQDKIGPLP